MHGRGANKMPKNKNKKNTKKRLSTLLIMVMILIPSIGFAGTYWVSPTGTATWANCRSATDPKSNYCSLATANANLVAGDTVYLKGGTYNTHIFPKNSGSPGNSITFQAYSSETPVIKNTTTTYATYYHALALIGKSYIKIDGITFGPEPTHHRLMMITHGGSYNEITNCVFDGGGKAQSVQIWRGNLPEPPARHNWVHSNIFRHIGEVSSGCDDIGGMYIGVPAYDNESSYNTIENNTFYIGGHHNLETFTKNNVIRNNYFHNEGSMVAPNPPCPYGPDTNGKYGNRNIQIYDGHNSDGMFNLIEGNRFGHSGPPPDDDGGDGFTLTAPKNIVRYNAIFNSQNNGILMKMGASSYSNNNRIYNNTVYKSGRYRNKGPQWQGYGIRFYPSQPWASGNVIKNNLLYNNTSEDFAHRGTSGTDNTIMNNWLHASGNPLFVNPDVSDPFRLNLPSLNLQSGSKAIDGGIYLTQAKGAGDNSTTLVVDDALYFQDGTWGSALSNKQADWIAIRDVGNVVQIKSINYSTNTITLASPMTWNDRANIWLYKKSDGTRVIYGSAPDFGAHEFNSGDFKGIAPPVNPRTQ